MIKSRSFEHSHANLIGHISKIQKLSGNITAMLHKYCQNLRVCTNGYTSYEHITLQNTVEHCLDKFQGPDNYFSFTRKSRKSAFFLAEIFS